MSTAPDWRAALADPNLTGPEVAECLSQDLILRLRSALRGQPIYLVLKACGQNRETIQAAIASCKDRTLAKFVENAYAITKSNDVYVIAKKIADLIVDGVVDRSSLYAGRHDHTANSVSHELLERESSARLEGCKPEIVDLLVASLSGRLAPAMVSASAANDLIPASVPSAPRVKITSGWNFLNLSDHDLPIANMVVEPDKVNFPWISFALW